MAHIHGIKAGLVPTSSLTPREQEAKSAAQEYVPAGVVVCEICNGVIKLKVRQKPTKECDHCARFFGDRGFVGVTRKSPEDTKEAIKKMRDEKWVMVLKRGSFGSGATTFTVEPGDIFPVHRAGDVSLERGGLVSNKDMTFRLFTLSIMIGTHELTLFTHEASAISFQKIMALRKDGDIKEVFVSTDDATGHFTPTPELRAEIYAMFGSLVNAPREQEDETDTPD